MHLHRSPFYHPPSLFFIGVLSIESFESWMASIEDRGVMPDWQSCLSGCKASNAQSIRCVFIAFDQHASMRMIRVKDNRTKVDYADFMKEIAQQYPDAESIRVVQDNINTHSAVRLMKPSHLRRLLSWPKSLSSILLQRRTVGLTWLRLSSLLFPGNV